MKELENVEIMFYSDYWDGPLAGLCEYENKIYRYETIDEGDYNEEKDEWNPRIYNVIEIEDKDYFGKQKKEHKKIDFSSNTIIGTFKR